MNRTIYTTSQLNIDGQDFLVKSVSYDRQYPKETIEQFGSKSFDLAQNEPTIGSIDFTFYPTGSIGGFFQNLKTQTEAHTPTRSSISSNVGSLQNALLTSLKGDFSIGEVPTMSAKFIGAFTDPLYNLSTSSNDPISSISTTANITGVGLSCAQKISFSWDIPVIAVPTYDESLTSPDSFFGDSPGKFTVNFDQVEGFVTPPTGISVGNFNISFSGHRIVSSGAGVAVGDLFASFSLGLEAPASSVTFS